MRNSFLQWFAIKFLDRTLQPRELVAARRLIYGFLILVLFTGSFLWRRYVVEAQANELALREESHGDLELSGSILRLTLTGSRGLATCALWMTAIEKQKMNQWNELEYQVRWLTRLQPHFITPWLFQSWNLAYNVSVESDRVNDKYFYITRGIELLAEGERQNRDNPDMRFSIGFYTNHKICNSDETNVHRSLFDLSKIPPNQRDPARFRVGNTNEFNWTEFEKFCKDHPRLVRRLREGLRRELKSDQEHQFTCETAGDVVQFLRDNWRVPGLYMEVLPTPDDSAWHAEPEKKKPIEDRFPVLPPPRSPLSPQRLFQPTDSWQELTYDSPLGDDADGHSVSRAWYSYSQEPIPDPDDLPGFTKEITDRARQRRPRNMTTLLFRQQPQLAQSARSDSLQQEGWFDDTPWVITGWFQDRPNKANRFEDGGRAQLVIPLEQSSRKSWEDASQMWRKHGESNHLLFPTYAEETNVRTQAEQYWKSKNKPFGSVPPIPGNVDPQLPHRERERLLNIEYNRFLDSLPENERKLYTAARFVYEYEFYRRLTNFPHHYLRPLVEAETDTVVARRLLFQAEAYRLQASYVEALDTYNNPKALDAWLDKVLSVKDLSKHKDFREDQFIQEQTVEIQLRYMDLLNDQYGKRLKQELSLRTGLMMQAGLPNQPINSAAMKKFITVDWVNKPGTLAMFRGPFDIDILKDPLQVIQAVGAGAMPLFPAPLLNFKNLCEGLTPLLHPEAVRTILDRKGLLPRKPDMPEERRRREAMKKQGPRP